MLGKNHARTTAASTLAGLSLWAYTQTVELPYVSAAARAVSDWVAPQPWLVLVGIPLAVVGSYLPDIDNEKSTIRRYIKVPIGQTHRGLTHTMWHAVFWLTLSVWEPLRCLWWVGCGVVSHILADALSKGGVALFYPLGRYYFYHLPDGTRALAPAKKYPRLYQVGKPSETRVVVLWLTLCSVVALAPWVYHFIIHQG